MSQFLSDRQFPISAMTDQWITIEPCIRYQTPMLTWLNWFTKATKMQYKRISPPVTILQINQFIFRLFCYDNWFWNRIYLTYNRNIFFVTISTVKLKLQIRFIQLWHVNAVAKKKNNRVTCSFKVDAISIEVGVW